MSVTAGDELGSYEIVVQLRPKTGNAAIVARSCAAARFQDFGGNAKYMPNNTVPPVPKPPAQTYSKEQIAQGKQLVNSFYCEECHGGPTLEGSGAWTEDAAIPDLRYAPPIVNREK
jgi:hypothetical protein